MSENSRRTLDTYDAGVQNYIDNTVQSTIGFQKQWLDEVFEDIPKTARVLEIGSAFGRDARYLQSLGYTPETTDGSQSFVEHLQSQGFGARVLDIVMDTPTDKYDVVLASAVFLHFNEDDFRKAVEHVRDSLTDNGRFVFSVKRGEGEEWTNAKMDAPRYFKYWQPEELRRTLAELNVKITEITNSIEKDEWLHVTAERSDKVKERVIAAGKIFELIHLEQDDGRVFEVARRAPGVRLIIADEANKKVLLTKEYRRELGEWDYRLPGGKVFDSLDEFEDFRNSDEDIIVVAKTKAIEEAQQEAGVHVADLTLFKTSVLGATVEWDLYVFESTNWQLSVAGQELEVGEKIEADNWISYDDAKHMILEGKMQEERIALILLQWLERK